MWRILKSLPCDIFLGAHGSYFGLQEKYRLMEDGANPFVDPEGYKRFITQKERELLYRIGKAKTESGIEREIDRSKHHRPESRDNCR